MESGASAVYSDYIVIARLTLLVVFQTPMLDSSCVCFLLNFRDMVSLSCFTAVCSLASCTNFSVVQPATFARLDRATVKGVAFYGFRVYRPRPDKAGGSEGRRTCCRDRV